MTKQVEILITTQSLKGEGSIDLPNSIEKGIFSREVIGHRYAEYVTELMN
jgi:hypothetical protein